MNTLKKYFPHFLLLIYIIEFSFLAIAPFDRAVWWAENLPILIPVILLIITFKKFRFSNLSYFLITFFFMFHTFGGHFTFERTPFEFFNNLLTTLNLDFMFPDGRNNFDRVGHFLAGILAYPVAELFLRKKWVTNVQVAIFLGIMSLGFWGALYEVIEMYFAIIAGGESGASFLGAQGDIWDAQKDMFLDILGAISVFILFGFNLKKYLIKNKKINITIDGPAGSGKGTTASILAKKLNYIYLDSGAIYRVVSLYFLNKGIEYNESERVLKNLRNIKIDFGKKGEVFLNEKDVTLEIRTKKVTEVVSVKYAKNLDIRHFVNILSKKIANKKGIVIDGRDAGAIFPNAELKIYLDADIDVRAKRRIKDFDVKNNSTELLKIKFLIEKRDLNDKKYLDFAKKNGIYVDTSNLSIDGQVQKVLDLAKNVIKNLD